MLTQLQFFFESDCAFEDADSALISAKRILKIIEDLGMVPPEITSHIWLRSENDFAMVNEWEPESD